MVVVACKKKMVFLFWLSGGLKFKILFLRKFNSVA